MLITNVPGPQVPLFAAGFPVDAMYPVAPLGLGQALAVSCTSYNGKVFFGMTADRDAIPDVEEFAGADHRGHRRVDVDRSAKPVRPHRNPGARGRSRTSS